jgi:hypothetical protein
MCTSTEGRILCCVSIRTRTRTLTLESPPLRRSQGFLCLAGLRKAVSPLRSATALQIGDRPKRKAQTVDRQNLECGGRGEVRGGDTAFLSRSQYKDGSSTVLVARYRYPKGRTTEARNSSPSGVLNGRKASRWPFATYGQKVLVFSHEVFQHSRASQSG